MPRPRLAFFLGLTALCLLLGTTSARAEEGAPEAVRLVSTWSVSPDGSQVALAWRGDLWLAPVAGGALQRVTHHPAEDAHPWFSPDGKRLAFQSNRSGSNQVYVMELPHGRARAISQHTEGFIPYGWAPDGKRVLVRARLDAHWRHGQRFQWRSLDPMDPLEMAFDAYGGSASVHPSGSRLAFVREGSAWWRKGYRGAGAGQIWTVDLSGPTYRKLTTGDHGERWPCWLPDGKHLIVSSQADGTFNLWRMDDQGKARTQLTTFEGEGALFPRVAADGSVVIFRRGFELWRLPLTEGAQPERIEWVHTGEPTHDPVERRQTTKATQATWSDDGKEVAFIAGGDVWVMDTELREPRQVTNTPHEEADPVFSKDFGRLYFTSDVTGDPDIFVAEREDPDVWWWQNESFAISRVTRDPGHEHGLRRVPGSDKLAFLHGTGRIVILDPAEKKRQVLLDHWDNASFDLSPDGAWVVWAVSDDDFNTDVWIAPVDGHRPPFNVSRHPDHDWSPVWSPDGKRIAFLARRQEDEVDIHHVALRKRDHEEGKRDRTLEKALAAMKKRKVPGTPAPAAPSPADPKTPKPVDQHPLEGAWSGSLAGDPPIPPDGLAFRVTIHAKTGALLLDLDIPGQVERRGLALTHDADAGTLSFETETPLGVLQVTGRVSGAAMEGTWVLGDLKGTFTLERDEAPAGDDKEDPAPPKEAPKAPKSAKPAKGAKAPPKVEIDFDGLADRVRRISVANTSEDGLFWSHDGSKLAFTATVNGSRGTYTVTFPDSLTPKRLSASTGSGARWLPSTKQIHWLVGGVPTTTTGSGKSSAQSFRVHQRRDRRDERGAAFQKAWRIMRDTFYDPAMGGSDWDALRESHGAMAKECVTGAELEMVINMMLGHLNASHLGFRSSESTWRPSGWRPVTGHLGLIFDPGAEGEGLSVARVIPTGPTDRDRSRVEAGERVLAIDGRPVESTTNLVRLLTGIPGRTVRLKVADAEGKERMVDVRPTTYGAIRTRLYEDWMEANRAAVDAASEGTLGYLHIRSMNWSSFHRFELELYKAGHGKDGLIIDVRDNGGGFTADHLLTCLMQPDHAYTVPRGGGRGYPQGRMVYARWNKPLVVLCNQNSFSNAEIFSHAVKTLGRGQVVGVPTAGGVISTGGTTIMGLGSFRLPFRGWFLWNDGRDMELNGCVPHHIVWPEPDDEAKGIDRQRAKAIEVLLADVAAWKAQPRPGPIYRSSGK